MADTVSTHWIYPPNWDGSLPDQGGFKRIIVNIKGKSDGTGETDVVKVDKSALQATSGNVPSRLVIEEISWEVVDMLVTLEWNTAPQETIMYMNGSKGTGRSEGHRIFKGGLHPNNEGGTGDIVLTSDLAAANGTYDISLTVRLRD